MLEHLEVGVITSTHGLKGEVNVYPTTDDVTRFRDLRKVVLARESADEDGTLETEVDSVKFFKGRPIVHFQGIDRIEEAERLKGYSILVDRADAVPLEEDEYFIGDLVGSEAFLEDGTRFGILEEILKTGANDVYVIRKADGQTAYLAGVKEFIREVHPEERRIIVRVMREI